MRGYNLATNTEVKGRGFIKRIRDGVKSNYIKASECEICRTGEDLELHHYHSVSKMANKWLKKNKIVITTDEDSMLNRDQFTKEHWDELVNQCTTLCNTHHVKLHRVYGTQPALATAGKQARWVTKQREKNI